MNSSFDLQQKPKTVSIEESSFIVNEQACQTATPSNNFAHMKQKIAPQIPKDKYNTQNYFTKGIDLGE